MRAGREFPDHRPEPTKAEQGLCIVLIVTCGIFLSPIFACATPFAALAAFAALNLGRRKALIVVGVVWVTNQAIGYGFLNYPVTWDSIAWGVAIGVSSALAVAAAEGLSTARAAPLAVSLPFVAAFAAFELGLYVAGFELPGSGGAFSGLVVRHIFFINAITICGLMVVYQVATMSRIFARNAPSAPGSIGAAF